MASKLTRLINGILGRKDSTPTPKFMVPQNPRPLQKSALMRRWDQVFEGVSGWFNMVTGLGIRGRDKRLGADIMYEFLPQFTVEAMYQKDDVAARIIDRPITEMFRNGYRVKIEGDDDKKIETALIARKDEFQVDKKVKKALKNAALYGGAGLIFGVPNQDPDKQLDMNQVRKLDYLVGLDRYQLLTSSELVTDLSDPDFGLPKFYQIVMNYVDTALKSDQVYLHHSWIHRIDGVELPASLIAQNEMWGDSILSRVYNAVRNYQTSHDSIATIIHDVTVLVMKLKGLSSMIASGEEGLVTKRLELATLMSSITNSIVIEEGEEFERKTTTVAGIKDLVDKIENRLVAATDMPHTILLGESPSGGLGQAGHSEVLQWYDHIKTLQTEKAKPALEWSFDMIFSDRTFVTKGKIPNYSVEFNPLWQLDEKEQAEVRKSMSEADGNYMDRGVVSAKEVRQSRWGGDRFSVETNLDEETDNDLDELTKPDNQKEEDENNLNNQTNEE